MILFNFSPLTLNPFPPKGAREVIAPQSLPAPFGGRMSEGQIRGCFKYGLFANGSEYKIFEKCIGKEQAKFEWDNTSQSQVCQGGF
jgi:hypothetical protein